MDKYITGIDEVKGLGFCVGVAHLTFKGKADPYAFACPLQVHCRYNTRQILAAYGYYNEKETSEF